MGWGAAIGGALGAAGSLAGAGASARAMRTSFKNRYQWSVADAKKAGLNPMLIAQNSPPVPQSPDYSGVGEDAMEGARIGSSALQAYRRNKEEVNLLKAQGNKEMATGEQVELQNTITKASQEYQDAIKAIGPSGEAGLSASSAKKWQLDFEGKEAIIRNANKDWESKDLQQKIMQQTFDWNRDIQPLLKKEQEYVNAARAAGLPELEAQASFWASVGAGGVVLDKLMEIIPGGEAIARMLRSKGRILGREKSTRRSDGTYEHTQESYDYER